MSIRVRFAPSPTGQVHIGNIRTAIFNYLFARHEHGEFLLRIEDTDLERSTQDAIDKLLECMQWLKMEYDGEIMYQSKQSHKHLEAAQKLIAQGDAYYGDADEAGRQVVYFRIPFNTDGLDCIREIGETRVNLHAESPFAISAHGASFAVLSAKGKPMPEACSLAGLKDLKLFDAAGKEIFDLRSNMDGINKGEKFSIKDAATMQFVRREVFYNDLIKGELSKPLDGMKDQIIVRSDGSPVFHLANVVDDITQAVTHIIRGDDHVENTYRHILLFRALGAAAPKYAHLPMIVNQSGKPYSKRDGDAFVGDFRAKGYLADSLFNYLSLLGWSPGDDREKMGRDELIEAFSLDRVKSAPAQLDMVKLLNMNGLYLHELDLNDFAAQAQSYLKEMDFAAQITPEKLQKVSELMQSRTKLFSQIGNWKYFFSDDFEYDTKNCTKQFSKAEICNGIKMFTDKVATLSPYTAENIATLIESTEEAAGLGHGKLFQPIRLAVTGCAGGAELDHTLVLIGQEPVVKRLKHTQSLFFTA